MSQIPSNVNIGSIDLVAAAGNYNQYGTTNVMNISDGGQYNVGFNAGGPNAVDLAAAVKELNTHISAGCMHNSADRLAAPKCHEDTRKAVQEDIFSWIDDGPTDEVLWLTGPAGTGKSAIMGTVCDKLKEKGQLAAAYYFSSFSGSLERKSKGGFVMTLAYQLQQYGGLAGHVSPAILSAVQKDPAVFRMSLQEQMERMILRPLREGQRQAESKSSSPMVILVDGVDECGEDQYDQPGRSRQGDQIEVLSVLLQAIQDPAFPFRVIFASRPETWIRSYFTDTAASKIHEIFLDDKYNPDDDIRLFLMSKFAELCRRYRLDPSTWPTEAVIDKLVEDASGQFIYVATVLRFIDTPGTFPQVQLAIVLKIKPQDKLNPFSVLDALYTSILRLSSSPGDTVLWLKNLHLIQERPAAFSPSAWTIDRIFESSAGEAQILLGGLPSLIHVTEHAIGETDSEHHGRLRMSAALIPEVGWTSSYTFYHKSFLDYLEDPVRCGAAFPGIDDDKVEQWLAGRFTQTLACGGPEVPIHPPLLLVFQRCFLDAFFEVAMRPGAIVRWRIDDNALSRCEPTVWLDVSKQVSSTTVPDHTFRRILYINVHTNCRSYLPCNPGCKRWRRAISNLPKDKWRQDDWSSFNILLNRFNIRRLEDAD